MFLQEIVLKKFRCFDQKKINFDKQVTIIIGDNGTGKTSLIEAIHYLSYQRSFRCPGIVELCSHQQETFFIKGSIESVGLQHDLQVGYAHKKKMIKLDGKALTSYKQLFDYFRVITLIEDDIDLIKGYPARRRSFIDQVDIFMYPDRLQDYTNFKQIQHQRAAFLHQYQSQSDPVMHEVWTHKLWAATIKIQQYRISMLQTIEKIANELLQRYFDDVHSVTIAYESKYILDPAESFEQFFKRITPICKQEKQFKRSLFGAHLDDFNVILNGKKARLFASRGQQKLLSFLIKLSQIQLANESHIIPILLLDDFISDFDETRLNSLISFLQDCPNQIFITTPMYDLEHKKLAQKLYAAEIFMK